MKLLIHCQTANVWPLQFGNRYVISSNTLHGMWLLIHSVPQFIGHLWYRISLQKLSLIPVSRNCVWRKCISRYYPTVLTFLHSSGTVALYACAKNQSNCSEKKISVLQQLPWHYGIEAETTWLPFCRWHFKFIYCFEKCCIPIQISLTMVQLTIIQHWFR